MITYDRAGARSSSLDAEGGADPGPARRRRPPGRGDRADRSGHRVLVRPLRTAQHGASTRSVHGRRSTYDADGHAIRQILPTGEVATSEFDVCGRVVEHHRPGSGTMRYRYDLSGRVVETRDPRNGRRVFSYDAAGQLVAVTDGNGGVTRYVYDVNGRAVEITNPLGGVTRREFDAMNRVHRRDRSARSDHPGRLRRRRSAGLAGEPRRPPPDAGRYDAAGRPASMAVDGRTVTALDPRPAAPRPCGSTTTPATRPSEHELEWNGRGQLVRRSRDGRAVTWAYDNAGRRTAMTTPDGRTTRYGWDAADRLHLGRAPAARPGRASTATPPAVSSPPSAGGILQSWEHRDGFVVAHTLDRRRGRDPHRHRPRRARPDRPDPSRRRRARRPTTTTATTAPAS